MFFNRLKIFLTLLLLLFLSILFWQNQELLALQLLCPEVNQSCLYQTPPLPLSLWMFVFMVIGVLTSLIWQLLNYIGNSEARKSKFASSPRYEPDLNKRPTEKEFTNTQAPKQATVKERTAAQPTPPTASAPKSDWEDDRSNDDWTKGDSTENKNVNRSRENTSKTQRTDTTYSYKSRPASKEQESKIDRVYDASYRVINPSLRKNTSESGENRQNDDDDEWI